MSDNIADIPAFSRAAGRISRNVFDEFGGRIRAFRETGGELIPLHIGDTHLEPPAASLRSPSDPRELSSYGPIEGAMPLRQAIVDMFARRGSALAGGPERVLVGCGCTHALFCASRALLDPGDEVLVMSPHWPLIPGVLAACGVTPVAVPMTQALYQDPDLDVRARLLAALSEKTRALYLITPSNPDGYIYTHAQLEVIATFVREHDLWLLADEVYADYVYDGHQTSIASLEGMAERTITAFSVSKSHALAGARIGYIIADERVVEATRKFACHTVYNVPVAMQLAAAAALNEGDSWQARARDTYRSSRDAMALELTRMGVPHHLPQGGSFFFVDLADMLGARPIRELLERSIDEGVLFAPGFVFGEGFETHARLCFTGAPERELIEGLRRLQRALDASKL